MRQELEQYLKEPICHYTWEPFISAEYNAQAKAALSETLHRAKQMLPRTRHVFIGRQDAPLHDGESNYLYLLLSVRKKMQGNFWVDACSDMVDVLHFFHIEDGRILNDIICLLEEFLE